MVAGAFSWLGDAVSWLGDRSDQLTGWAGHWWYLALIFVIALLDAMIPVVPSETAVIIGGVAVATGVAPYSLWPVIVAGALGAFVGDNISFTVGHHFAPRLERRAGRKPKFATRLEAARHQIAGRGGMLLITARFLPGGRTILTLACGITRQRRRWFVLWDALATLIWASYAGGLAFIVGKPLEEHQSAAFWTAFGTAILLNVVIELVRRQRHRNHPPAVPETPAEVVAAAEEQ
jgi:membrane protein DedA with SNARE-associated domain